MLDTNHKAVEVGQEATAHTYGHILKVKIYEVTDNNVYFKTINPEIGQPETGDFNRLECSRYLFISKEAPNQDNKLIGDIRSVVRRLNLEGINADDMDTCINKIEKALTQNRS